MIANTNRPAISAGALDVLPLGLMTMRGYPILCVGYGIHAIANVLSLSMLL